jgi:uncharacterized membrane protein
VGLTKQTLSPKVNSILFLFLDIWIENLSTKRSWAVVKLLDILLELVRILKVEREW